MKYRICDWENNGYHDSDFMGVYFDTETGEMKCVEIGSTRYAGGDAHFGESEYLLPTPEIVEQCRQLLEAHIFKTIKAAEMKDILEPEDCSPMDLLMLLAPHNSRKTGQKLEAGQVIRVNQCTAFGQFYAKGYNKPNRTNRSVIGTLQGRPDVLVRVPLEKCRMHKEPLTDSELLERAKALSHHHNYGAMFGCRGWMSNNWAGAIAKKPDQE